MKEYTLKVSEDGSKKWYLNGKLHREDGPAVECSTGTKEWYLNGDLHRKDGPAVEYEDGRTVWYLNGRLHREDGPAYERMGGIKEWYLSGKLHREDGPAIDCANGRKVWYLDGKEVTEEEHKRRTGGTTMEDALARLIRIMGTFDLATGHADTMDQALDALEEELRDVLGHLRARR